MVYEFRNQPWFGLYVAYQLVTTTLFRLPFWYAVSYPQSWRPRPSWSLKRAVLVRLFRHLYSITQKTGPLTTPPTHRAIRPGPGIKAVWVDPCPHLITGPLLTLAIAANVSCARIPGYWIDRDASLPAGAPPQPNDKLLYRLHGGAYIQLSAHPSDPTANIARGMLRHCPSLTRTFAVEYRLSSARPYEDANPFPAALVDALAGYRYLVEDVGFSPRDIVVLGDSAGGNLALALVRYLRDSQPPSPASGGQQGREYVHTHAGGYPQVHVVPTHLPTPLPLPHALVLLSPWTDLSTSHAGPNSSLARSYASDYTLSSSPSSSSSSSLLSPLLALLPPLRPLLALAHTRTRTHTDAAPNTHLPLRASYPKHAFLGPLGTGFAAHSVYVSPACLGPFVAPHATFGGFPRTWVCAGGAEPLVDSIRTLWWRMERDLGRGCGGAGDVDAEQVEGADVDADGEGERWTGGVVYYEAEDALHDHVLFPWHEPEVGETLRRVARWLEWGW
ncbi:Alpha/Beta hydrolase protein [Phlebopus sp. FC_14]|nr:Alpha/Beta hydrolase protein [Phlebopus sp. FC_14]